MATAEESRNAGCYTCLVEALTTYERIAADARAPRTAIVAALETAVLLVVRAKELGLPSDEWRARAASLAGRVPAAATALAPTAYLDAAALLVGETSGLDPEIRQLRTRRPALVDGKPVRSSARMALDAAPATDGLAAYLGLALDCDQTITRLDVDAESVFRRYGRPPALRFRLAICGAARDELRALRDANPQWTDTLLFEGRRELAQRPVADLVRAVELLMAAHEAFPESHAVTLSLAGAEHALGEFASALAHYDAVLADEPTHRDAWLGRVTSLSYLARYVDAVTAATRLIELGTWHTGDAYYWRAWNRYQLYQLPTAWEDVERATALLVNTAVYTLAGYIAYARAELDTAIDRFDRAYAMDRTNCEAVWFAGLVHVDRQDWNAAAPKFSTGMVCFTAAATEARGEMAAIGSASYAETLKARRMAAAQKRLDTAEHRAAQAAFNAAQCFLRLGNKGEATVHLDAAALHPLLKDKARTLRPAIDKLPG
jgi:tetratricopeptide (TPR) repeat protein